MIDELEELTHEKTLSKEEIALRLVEAWGKQSGPPASFTSFLNNYDRAIEHLKKYEVQDE